MSEFRLYPRDWPRCLVCGTEALDGHLTCGRVACSEAEAQAWRTPRLLTCLAYFDDGRLGGELATTVEPQRMIVVCATHPPRPVPPSTGEDVWAK